MLKTSKNHLVILKVQTSTAMMQHCFTIQNQTERIKTFHFVTAGEQQNKAETEQFL